MLEGSELEKAIQNIMKQLRSVNLLYIRKVAMQIRKIGEMSQSSINRLVAMAEMNADIAEITDRLRMMAGVTARELQKVYVKAMNEQFTDPRFRKYLAKFPMKDSGRQRIERYVRSVYRQTAARLYNFSNTTAVREDYVQAVDRAILAASTGAASYSETMRETVRQLGRNGIQIVYASGHKRRLDTAVRQNIADGVNQINKNASIMIGEELGYDAIEISAHARSAPDHEPVQGHVFLLAEFQNMQAGAPFKDIDGHAFAGFRRPIGEWNCRHTPMSFSTQWSKRKWTDEQLQKFIDENQAGCTINGKHKTLYEAMQMMRGLETEIRRQKDTAVAAQAAGDDTLRQQCQLKINALVRQYAAVAKASGNAEKRQRMTVEGFRAVKTPPDNSNALTKLGKDGKIDLQAFKKDLASGRIKTAIEDKQQVKHQLTPEWKNQVKQAIQNGGKPKSRLTKGIDPQEIVDNYSGKGILRAQKGNYCVDEFVSLPYFVGVTFDKDRWKYIPTHRVQIKYTKGGTHVIPVLERK